MDDYLNLPPMTPGGVTPPEPSVEPKAPPLPADAVVDEDEFDDVDEVGEDESPDEDEVSDESGDGVKDDADNEVAVLREKLRAAEERAQQAAEWERHWAEQQRIQQQQQAEQYWSNAEAEAEHWFRAREAAIYKEAEDAVAPIAYVQQQMGALNQQRVQWFRQFNHQKEQAYWQYSMQQALPRYAQEVAEYHGLSRDAVQELLMYPADLIPREAERMAREKQERANLKRAATQAARKAKNRELSNGNVLTGGGGKAPAVDVPLDSDEFYNSIPWQRVSR